MCFQKNSEIIVFIPVIFIRMENFKHLPSFQCNDDYHMSFGAKTCYLFNATIDSSPYYDKIISGMPTSDVMFGFKQGNFGAYIHFPVNNSKLLTTWSVVLEGSEKGMQMWKKGNRNSDLFPLFQNKHRSANDLPSCLHNFSIELFGDPYATSQLLNE